MDKHFLRQDILRQRDALTLPDVKERSLAIARRFIKTSFFQRAKTILCYYPKGKEVNTELIIQYAFRSGKTIVLPATQSSTRTLRLYRIKNLQTDLVIGQYGIKEPNPETCKEMALRDIDLILIPAIALDQEGNRIGYGLGYYDRLLASYTGPTVAVVYDFQVLLRVPQELHDIPLHYIITESRFVQCRKLNK